MSTSAQTTNVVYFKAFYVYDEATIELDFAGGRLPVKVLKWDGNRYSTVTYAEVSPGTLELRDPGVYGWYFPEDTQVTHRIVKGTVELREKQGVNAGKDPWPPPPPPPRPFDEKTDPLAARRFPVHAYAHHEDCGCIPSELFIAAIG